MVQRETQQVQLDVGGMHCSFCAETLEQAFEQQDGVSDVDVSLAHEEVLVRYNPSRVTETEIRDTLRELGYTLRDPDKQKRFEEQKKEIRRAKWRLTSSGVASAILATMMIYMLIRWRMLESMWLWLDIITGVIALMTMFGPGWYIKKKAYYSLRRGIFNQHVLLEAGAFAGVIGGVLGLTIFPSFPTMHFFAVSTFLTTYHILSGYSSLVVRTRASQSVRQLLDMHPDTARRIVDGGAEEVPLEHIEEGDLVRVKPGERIPVDGQVVEGSSAVDESVATGESTPVDKEVEDEVIGGGINETGTLLIRVTATGDDAFLHQVAQQVEEARAMKPRVLQLADVVLTYFVPGVFVAGLWAFVFWTVGPLTLGAVPNVQRAVFASLAVFVLGYPCALGMATPLALIRGGGEAARRGVLMRSGDAFQIFHDIDTVIFDKTGTITDGEPSVAEVVADEQGTEEEVVAVAASAEAFSEHPLAKAVITYAEENEISYEDPDEFDSITGQGVEALLDGEILRVGKLSWLEDEGVVVDELEEAANGLRATALTVVGVAREENALGIIGIGDRVKDDAARTVERVREAGMTPMILTGDDSRTADAVAEAVGIGAVQADVMPGEKTDVIRELQKDGKRVAMVGDGINDAPALMQSDIGIAIGAGTDIAIESADVVCVGDRLGGVMDGYEIGRESYRRTRQNVFIAFFFNGIGVPAAMTGLVHPVFAMIAMIASVSLVLVNSFGGQLLKGEGIKTDVTVGQEIQDGANEGHSHENESVGNRTVRFAVNLHCEGCEKTVQASLQERDGVKDVEADAESELVEVTYDSNETDAETLQEILEDSYEVERL